MSVNGDIRGWITRHVRQPWNDFLDLTARGGLVVQTSDPAGSRVLACTTVQLDGDVVTRLHPRIEPESAKRHHREVMRRVRTASTPARTAAAVTTGLATLTSSALTLRLSWENGLLWREGATWGAQAVGVALGLLGIVAVGAGTFYLVRRLLSAVLRLVVGRAFRRFLHGGSRA